MTNSTNLRSLEIRGFGDTNKSSYPWRSGIIYILKEIMDIRGTSIKQVWEEFQGQNSLMSKHFVGKLLLWNKVEQGQRNTYLKLLF